MKLIKIFSIFILLPAILAGRNGIVEKKTPFYKQNYKFVSRSPEKNAITSLKRNLNPPSNENNNTLVSCSPQATITPGIVVKGDTTGEANKFSGDDYPGLGWDEAGPDFVYQITLSSSCDFRIHIDPDPNILPDLDIILIDNTGGSCNTANWIYAGDHTIIYPDAHAGTYYIIVDGYTKDDAGQYTLYTACANNLLIIDADGSGTSGPTLCGTNYCTDVWANSTYGTNYFYKTAIEGISPTITYSYWDKTAQGGKLPEESTLYSYKSIIWFSGKAWGDSDPNTPPKIITQDDEELLRKYLNLGGRIAIIGQDILWDYSAGTDGRLPDGSILNDYFQINSVYNDVWVDSEAFDYSTCSSTYPSIPIWGVPGNPLGDDFGCDNAFYLFCSFRYSNGAPFSSYIDSIFSRYGEPAFDTYWKSTDDKTTLPTAIRYTASLGIMDWFKTAFFAFSPETNYRTGDTTTVITRLRALLKRILDWFEEDSTSTRVPNGIDFYADFDDTTYGDGDGMPEPGETFNLIFGAQNNTGHTISLKAYEGFEDWYTTLPSPWCQDMGEIPNGGYSEVTFSMTLSANAPIGYRFTPLINVSQYYDETFEGAGGFDYDGWTHYPINGTTDWVWTTAQSQTPTHSWFAQDVGYVNDKVLESPIIYVNQFTSVSFYHKYTFHYFQSTCRDGGTIEYATGPLFENWTVIPDSWFAQNGFNGTVSSSYGNPIGGKSAFCGTQSSWFQTIINLSSLAGKEVKIRWHEGDDSSTGSTGWYVDTITIESYNTAVGFGLFVGQADVMLVKDEYWLPNTTAVDMYEEKIKSIQNPLTGQNYTVAQWDTSVFAAPTYDWYGLSNDWMKNYLFVIWFTGFDFLWTLTLNPWETSLGIDPEAELSYFLQNKYSETGTPARLILSSQDYLYDKYEGRNTNIPQNDFARVYLKVDYVEQDYIKDAATMLKGIDGIWVSEKMNMSLNNDKPAGAYFKNYADLIIADLSEDGTEYTWTYNLPTSFSATQNLKKNRNSRFLFMPFAFENLQDGEPDGFPSKKRFLEKVMCQMMMNDSSSYPPCGYSRPYPAYSFTIYGIKQGTSDAYFYWSSPPSSFRNCAGEEISGFYRIFGALNNPNRASFSLLSKAGQENYLGIEDVPAGSCFYYELRDWVDTFDISAVSSCP